MAKFSDALKRHNQSRAFGFDILPTQTPSERLEPTSAHEFLKKPLHGQRFNHKLPVLSAPDSFDAENFKVLRTQILFPKNCDTPKTILVTSVFPGEGKTFVATNFAASIALGIDEHVLLVDCDFRRPGVHHIFGLSNSKGLQEYLSGTCQLPEALLRTSLQKLSVLPAGGATQNSPELLSSKKMRTFIEEVKTRYNDRYVVLDSTPTQTLSESSVLSNYVDAVILVLRAYKSPRVIIHRGLEYLEKTKIVGVVFNGYNRTHNNNVKFYKKYYECKM